MTEVSAVKKTRAPSTALVDSKTNNHSAQKTKSKNKLSSKSPNSESSKRVKSFTRKETSKDSSSSSISDDPKKLKRAHKMVNASKIKQESINSSRHSIVSSKTGPTESSKASSLSRTAKKCTNSVHSGAEEPEQWKYFSFVSSYMVTGPVALGFLTFLIFTVACVDSNAEDVFKHFFLIVTVYGLAKCM